MSNEHAEEILKQILKRYLIDIEEKHCHMFKTACEISFSNASTELSSVDTNNIEVSIKLELI